MLLWAVLSTLTQVDVGSGSSFDPEAICAGFDKTSPAAEHLRGKHLRVLEMESPPYAYKNSSAPYGWRGFDIDLLEEIAALLGFTFEIHEATSLPTETQYAD